MKQYDALVVGGGPAGLTAAMYLCRSGVSVALVEMMGAGGQILKTSDIANYPGYPKGISGWDLANLFASHLDEYTLDRYTDTVKAIEPIEGQSAPLYCVQIGKDSVEARTVLLCTGASPRPLGLADEARLVGRGVSYCALCDGNFFRGQDVAVVGGGNSALEESLYLAHIVKKVYLIHRRDSFRGAKVVEDRVRATANIELILNHIVTGLDGAFSLQGLSLKNTQTGAESSLKVEGLFVFAGYQPQNNGCPSNLKLDEHGFIVTDGEMRTNLPGIFAAGDIRSKQCRQVATAVGDGATAATAAFGYLQQIGA